ncbi:MAG: insulinase family protein [Desulfovibrionaceae bacterium]
MAQVHGFTLVSEREIPEIGGTARMWRHGKTGAQLLSMSCADENKVFGVSFRTPPEDSTGVAHILEHSVLCGSRRYPVKEPFVELLKGSLKTFLNAFTYPDKTCYPVASTNLQDFYNLVDVYLDAVFFPRISEDILRQEGWHVDMADPDAAPAFKGVVFNEMKGAYSSPDSVLYETAQHSLFPDTTYGVDSGGDPARIPDLTYARFKRFHEVNYHPGNARFYFYGDDPEDARLAKADAYCALFEPLGPDAPSTSVGVQARFDAPRRVEERYAASDSGEEGDGNRAMCVVNWLLPEPLDPEVNYAFQMLEHVLAGMPASPLRMALIESGLGEDVAGAGMENELRQMYFSVGLKGIALDDADAVEALVLDTLAAIAEQGVPAQDVEAAVNSVEFDLRENNTGSFPRGLHVMLRALTTWLYDGDPLAMVAFEAPLAAIKARLAAGEPVFENMIRTHLLDNPHRTTVVLAPDAALQARRDVEEAARLDALVGGLDRAGREALAAQTAALKAMQEAEDTPEALATIPRLGLADMDRENKTIPLDIVAQGGADEAMFLAHDIPTAGIAYLDLGFDLSPLPQALLPLAPLFGRALLEMGTDASSFVDLSMRIAAKTGGIDADTMATAVREGSGAVARLFLRGKATVDKVGDLADILREVLLGADFSDRERFRQIVLEEKARLEQRLVPAGHRVVAVRLGARFSRAGWVEELLDGVVQLQAVRALAKRVESDFDGVRADLETVRSLVLRRGGAVCNLTVDPASRAGVEARLGALLAALPAGTSPAAAWAEGDTWPDLGLAAREGLAIPAQVNYVGKAANIYDLGYRYHGSAGVIAKHLSMGWLWDQVRVQGGAYGAFCLFDRFSGEFAFVSYRDPNLSRTLGIYDASADYLRRLALKREELESAIVGAIGVIDLHLLPDARGYASMTRLLAGDTDAVRQHMRDEVLGTTQADFAAFGEVLGGVAREGRITVLGSRAALTAAAMEEGWQVADLL